MLRYQVTYQSPKDGTLQNAVLENDQEFADTMEILDKNNAPYDSYIIVNDKCAIYLFDHDERMSK